MNYEELTKKTLAYNQSMQIGNCVALDMEIKGCCHCGNQDSGLCEGSKNCRIKMSEIEKMFAFSFMNECGINYFDSEPPSRIDGNFSDAFLIQREVKIDKYRVDFVCSLNSFFSGKNYFSSVIVECDSQKWHETTENQRRYEKERDRFLQTNGSNVLRFTGKEIMEDPKKCSFSVIEFLKKNKKLSKIQYEIREVKNG